MNRPGRSTRAPGGRGSERRSKFGRPPLPQGTARTQSLSLRVPAALLADLNRAARTGATSRNDLAIQALETFLAKKP